MTKVKWDREKLSLGIVEILTDATLLRRARQNPVALQNKDLIKMKADARAYVAEFAAAKLERMRP
jgi:hypothetical protein